jgi:hypothetical protein
MLACDTSYFRILGKLPSGQFFVHFFPRKVTFRGKFRGICWKNDFSKIFPRKIPIFFQHFLELTQDKNKNVFFP